MTLAERLACLNTAILAVRTHGFLAESVLEPLQTLRDDLAADSTSVPAKPVLGPFVAPAGDGVPKSGVAVPADGIERTADLKSPSPPTAPPVTAATPAPVVPAK